MDARSREPRQALAEQLRTVSDQLSESLESLVGIDGSYPPAAQIGHAEAAATGDPTVELLERIRELEAQAQYALEQRRPTAPPSPVPAFAPMRRSPRRSPRPSNPRPDDEKRPAWGSPLGSPNSRREQFAAARARSGATSPRRRAGRSPSTGRASTPTGRPPTPGKKKRDHQRDNALRVEAPVSNSPEDEEPLSAWGTAEDASAMHMQAQPLPQADRPGAQAALVEHVAGVERTGQADAERAPASAQSPHQLQQKISEMELAEAAAASHRNVLEQRLAESEKELASARAKLLRTRRAASPGKRGRSPRRSSSGTTAMSPEEQTRLESQQTTSPRRGTSPGRSGDVILSRGSREEKEKMLAQIAALRQSLADAEQRVNVEMQGRQAAEAKTRETENVAAELASALNVMTAHCEELERQAVTAAARESEMKAAHAANIAKLEEQQAAEVASVKLNEEREREEADDTLGSVVDGVVAAAEGDVGKRLGALQVDMTEQIAAMEAQVVQAQRKAEAEFSDQIRALEETLARERGEREAEKLEHDWHTEALKDTKLALEVAEAKTAETLTITEERIRAEVKSEAQTQVLAAKAEAEAGWSELCDILGSQATEAMETSAAAQRSAREAELAVSECEAKLSAQRQTITSLQSTVASIDRIKAEAAAAQHERDIMAEQLKAALGQTRKMEIACQEWIAEVQREARLSMALSPSLSQAAAAGPAPAQSGLVPQRRAEQLQGESRAAAALQTELEALRSSPWYQLSSLQQHGAELGLSPQKLAEATGAPNPEEELVGLILAATGNPQSGSADNNS